MAAVPSESIAPPHPQECFHCGLPVPARSDHRLEIEGVTRPFCCRGCEAVAGAILAAGLADYYRHRTARPASASELVPELLRETAVYDHPEVQRGFVRDVGESRREAALILENIVCPACLWLNEQHLRQLPGIVSVAINYASRRAQVAWDERALKLSDILRAIATIGYRAHPYDPRRAQLLLERERRGFLKRLAVAAIFGMQVMLLAVALWFGEARGIEAPFRDFFRWASLVLCLPVLLYSAQPFFRSAWRDLRARRAGMDVPVALGMALAFGGSVWATVSGTGEVWYDSVAMFAAFLLTGRYFELMARARAAEAAEALARATPALATRLRAGGGEESVAVVDLRPGDRLLVRAGETIPADGTVIAGRSSVDEALLTGESRPVPKGPGERLIGGGINRESPLTFEVSAVGPQTVLSSVLRLLERAQAEKPALAHAADRAAGRFVVRLLAVALAVGLWWYFTDPRHWLPILVSVLVVSCPCALSLAAPAALTAASGRLMRLGVLATRGHALETLARATHFVFDKTGTLTRGRLQVMRIEDLADDAGWRARAAALERRSEHPIARALAELAPGAGLAVEEVANTPGGGIEGMIGGDRLFLGSPAFIRARTGLELPAARRTELAGADGTLVLAAAPGRLLGAVVLRDELRAGAADLVAGLKAAGKPVLLLSGDQEPAVRAAAAALGIEECAWGLDPQAKLARLRALQQDGAIVAMIGDGVNDAPVLAGAQVSIAIGEGAALAAASGDLVLLAPRLTSLTRAIEVAGRMLRITHQNLAWAVAYNLTAIPAAALGYVTPWLAALGMSLSSLLVVGNALRLTRRGPGEGP